MSFAVQPATMSRSVRLVPTLDEVGDARADSLPERYVLPGASRRRVPYSPLEPCQWRLVPLSSRGGL